MFYRKYSCLSSSGQTLMSNAGACALQVSIPACLSQAPTPPLLRAGGSISGSSDGSVAMAGGCTHGFLQSCGFPVAFPADATPTPSQTLVLQLQRHGGLPKSELCTAAWKTLSGVPRPPAPDTLCSNSAFPLLPPPSVFGSSPRWKVRARAGGSTWQGERADGS